MFKETKKHLLSFPGILKNSKWILALVKPFIPYLLLILFLDTVITLLGVASAIVSKFVVDTATSHSSLITNIIILVSVTLVTLAMNLFSALITTVINEKFTFYIRQKLFDKILKTRWVAIAEYHSGDLLTRLKSDVGAITSGITDTIPSIITLVVRIVAAFFTLWYFDSTLALFALIIGPITAIVSWIMGRKLKALQLKVQESESKYSSFLQESLENILIIKSFVSEEHSSQKLKELHLERLHWILKKNRMTVITSTVMSLFFSGGYLVAFIWGVLKLSLQQITYGTMTAFLSLVSQIQGPIFSLAKTIPQLITIMASVERLSKINSLECEPKIEQITNAPVDIGIDIDHVDFAYLEEKIINDAKIKIAPGDTVAIVGRSGIGKTTLVRLLMGFIYPQSGLIEFYDLDGYTISAGPTARHLIAYVPQGNTLFSGSIEYNLQIAKPDATHEEMRSALDAAAASFVFDLPLGLDTVIGERGQRLSEGQAQRIAIARAILRKSPLLILDEATSSLDEPTELKILEGIKKLEYNPTCVMITHRKSILAFCNRKIEIENGKLMESTLL